MKHVNTQHAPFHTPPEAAGNTPPTREPLRRHLARLGMAPVAALGVIAGFAAAPAKANMGETALQKQALTTARKLAAPILSHAVKPGENLGEGRREFGFAVSNGLTSTVGGYSMHIIVKQDLKGRFTSRNVEGIDFSKTLPDGTVVDSVFMERHYDRRGRRGWTISTQSSTASAYVPRDAAQTFSWTRDTDGKRFGYQQIESWQIDEAQEDGGRLIAQAMSMLQSDASIPNAMRGAEKRT